MKASKDLKREDRFEVGQKDRASRFPCLLLTWYRLSPLDCSHHLPPSQHVEGGEYPPAGVGQGAVVARVQHLRLNHLQQGHQGRGQLRQGGGNDALVSRRFRAIPRCRCASLLDSFYLLLCFSSWESFGKSQVR